MQYALGIPPNLRTNIDYIFILLLKIMFQIEKDYKYIMSVVSKF